MMLISARSRPGWGIPISVRPKSMTDVMPSRTNRRPSRSIIEGSPLENHAQQPSAVSSAQPRTYRVVRAVLVGGMFSLAGYGLASSGPHHVGQFGKDRP